MSIEKYLVLNKYFLSLFGKKEFKELQILLKDVQTGVDSDGRSYFVNVLKSLDNSIGEERLINYDRNIQEYLKKINQRRQFDPKYFQYLAILFTEILLDNLKNNKSSFLASINSFFSEYIDDKKLKFSEFTEDDLRRIAFWMATGSGKTLIMHINYYQFLKYRLFNPNNIILITPNEGLSRQHFEELQKSGIPCEIYRGNGSLNSSLKFDESVIIIEITKLTEEKKGGGVSIQVDALGDNNLVFVDEGHKGGATEERKWMKLRDRLSERGFVFEYSATFGQILREDRNIDLLEKYSKSIIFDYSYKYFYLDGYGKDFQILNLIDNKDPVKNSEEIVFVANLLSFYEQLLVYEDKRKVAEEHNIEKPLWIFVGTTVTGGDEESDVIKIVRLFEKFLRDESWAESLVDSILRGNSGLLDREGEDAFSNKFNYLKNKYNGNIKDLLDDVYQKVFGGKGNLRLFELKRSEGEIGLRAGENDYFGVINIGDVRSFEDKMSENGIEVSPDVLSDSLFYRIKSRDSKINVLIGSKKFIEGWDTWRVSSMGLLNIGQSQGPQIIQLFGRGVRLKGKDMSLKRQGTPEEIRILETLNIFGINADYLKRFLDAINREEVDLETILVPIKFRHKEKWRSLYTLSKPTVQFEDEKFLELSVEKTINLTISLIPKIDIYKSSGQGAQYSSVSEEYTILRREDIIQYLKLLNWKRIYNEMVEFKMQRNYWNLVFTKKSLEGILSSSNYEIYVSGVLSSVSLTEYLSKIEDIALLVIKKYTDIFYRRKLSEFETEKMQCQKLDRILFLGEEYSCEDDGNNNKKPSYVLKIDKRLSKEIVKKIEDLLKNLNKLVNQEDETLPRIYFDRSLYLPLLIQSDNIESISPPGLVESEKKFLEDLRNYLERNYQKLNGYEVYLLRNYPFSGVGFQLEWSKFYPDFIMWLKRRDEDKQVIAFIDPKGLIHSKGLDDEKVHFCSEGIREIQTKLNGLCSNVILQSFILSYTPYEDLVKGTKEEKRPSQSQYEDKNVLFLKDSDWTEKLFRKLISVL